MNALLIFAALFADPTATVAVLRAEYAYAHQRPELPDTPGGEDVVVPDPVDPVEPVAEMCPCGRCNLTRAECQGKCCKGSGAKSACGNPAHAIPGLPGVFIELDHEAIKAATASRAEPTRYIIQYAVPGCPPCKADKEQNGEGDEHLGIRYADGQYGQIVGKYRINAAPFYYDPVNDKAIAGRATLDQLKAFAGVKPSYSAAPAYGAGTIHGKDTIESVLKWLSTGPLSVFKGQPLGPSQNINWGWFALDLRPTTFDWDLRSTKKTLTFQEPLPRVNVASMVGVPLKGLVYENGKLTVLMNSWPSKWEMAVVP